VSAASTPTRTPPHVPHHSVVREIGRGSYGEIWLARSLTGAWRAIKIVDRSRFDDTRAFDREFDGMAKFEPVSREHGGFVDILHVGRSDDDAFFYYVMELADDIVSRECFEPALYEPKTLKSELQRVARLPAEEAINLGLSLTLALSALHRHGLVHRDIKPANIIFVGGHPKIADIGLVSPLGQASFVGTEGYVPPEGPGTAQADIYSLGKVVYELAMGKDRLEFPEVNTDIDVLPDREQLLRLNQVLWRACAHSTADRYETADQMHDDLARVRAGKPLRDDSPVARRWLPIVALLAITGTAVGWWANSSNLFNRGKGFAYFETDPPGVQIRFEKLDDWITTPRRLELPAGTHIAHALGGTRFDKHDFEFTINPNEETRIPKIALRRSKALASIDSIPKGCDYELRDGDVVKTGKTPDTFEWPTGNYDVVFRHGKLEKSVSFSVDRGAENTVRGEFLTRSVMINSVPAGAEILCDGEAVGKAPKNLTLLEGKHRIIGRFAPWPDDARDIVVGPDGDVAPIALAFPTASLKITTKPAGATVLQNGVRVGDTTNGAFFKEDLPPGEYAYTFRLERYKDIEKKFSLKAGERKWEPVVFEARPGPRKGEPWTNSLGMSFVPVTDNLLAGVWLVRVRDYAAYAAETGRPRIAADFTQDDNHPVIRVNWDDARLFCEWLTQHEKAAGKLDEGQLYRLPTDAEWSLLAGLPPETGDTPEQRDGTIRDFTWGKTWPPPANAGNFADSALRQGTLPRAKTAPSIGNYNDGFAYTSPVGTFPANALGLFDISGNVWQWVSDSYSGTQKKDWGVLRGGSWASSKQEELRLGYRNVVSREERDVIFGFRCVLVPGP
jgi:formylglycine-generating enzyme required for sulfatase activity/serine/threonine protein kinase